MSEVEKIIVFLEQTTNLEQIDLIDLLVWFTWRGRDDQIIISVIVAIALAIGLFGSSEGEMDVATAIITQPDAGAKLRL